MRDPVTETALCCMMVSNPGDLERPPGWQKRVNDHMRAQRDRIAALEVAIERLLPVARNYGGLTDEHADAIKNAEATIRYRRKVAESGQ